MNRTISILSALALSLATVGCAQSRNVFGEDIEVGAPMTIPAPDSLTVGFYPDAEFTSATVQFTTSEMDEWDVMEWDELLDSGDGVEFTLYDAPDSGWVAFHGWAEAPAIYAEQICTLGEGIEYPAGEVEIEIHKSEPHWGYSAQQEGLHGSCYLVYDWFVGDGERLELPNIVY